MDKFVINGGIALKGEVTISGAKNAAVAIIPSVLLADSPCIIENVPDISDVKIMVSILQEMGAIVKYLDRNTIEIDPRPVETDLVPDELARHLRGSYYFLGSLLGRFNKAQVPLPGGCNFGVRPIDQHIKGFEALGCSYNIKDNGIIELVAKNGLNGTSIYLDVVTVGATINILLSATKANGITVIENAAREPHVVDLANFLNSMGADIRGAGTDVIKIHGVAQLSGKAYSIIPDQIEAGTYMVAAAATGGDVLIKNITPKHLESISAKLEEMGATIEEFDDSIRVFRTGEIKKCNVKTMPHPGFPTDMQPQIVALLSCANGISMVTEGVWDNRFQYVDELKRMGAKITVNGRVAVVEGVSRLKAAPVRSTDLRAGAAMVIAGLVANGTTYVEDVKYIQRGYDNIVQKLVDLGADIFLQSKPSEEISYVG
ncbi:MAG: UDP-N-acetylglucosamine 1-carboxyvinyltransferase [Clostridia bacterium]